MSFKREGNDRGLLSVLQKRRIQELFAEDIPENEAKLLANGRFTCLVCSSNPIFDTIPMLSVHRRGKKHEYYAAIHKRKKEELKQLIAKRKHEKFLKSGSTSIDVACSEPSRLTNSSPYDPRVKRKATKGGRKLQICLDRGDDDKADSIQNEKSSTVSYMQSGKDNNTSQATSFQNICQQQQQGPVKHDAQLKKLFYTKSKEPITLSPYTPKHKIHDQFTSDNSSNTYCHNHKKFCHENCLQSLPPAHQSSSKSHQSPPQTQPYSSNYRHPSPLNKCESQGEQKSELIVTQQSLAKKYHQIQGSGWKRDWDGKWIKDDQAEFDSDEEPPDF